MSPLARLLCLLTALTVVEGHLLIGQGVAWLTMIRDRTPELGFESAVADTFSGENPCQMCHAVQNEREREKEQAPLPETSPLAKAAPTLLPDHRLAIFPPKTARPDHPRTDRRRTPWQRRVPTPPPWLG